MSERRLLQINDAVCDPNGDRTEVLRVLALTDDGRAIIYRPGSYNPYFERRVGDYRVCGHFVRRGFWFIKWWKFVPEIRPAPVLAATPAPPPKPAKVRGRVIQLEKENEQA